MSEDTTIGIIPCSLPSTNHHVRKQNLVLYIMPGFKRYDGLMARLGKYRTGSSCLYVNKLDDVDLDVLAELIRQSLDWMKSKYPEGI